MLIDLLTSFIMSFNYFHLVLVVALNLSELLLFNVKLVASDIG
jgi:hypothetical protein